MKLTIDKAADALYLGLAEDAAAQTRQVAPGIVLDYDNQGRVVGIEVLSVSRRAGEANFRSLVFETLG